MIDKAKYKHIFFDLDHTLWDFEANSAITLVQLIKKYDDIIPQLKHDEFVKQYSIHNAKLWTLLEKGLISRTEVRVNRFHYALTDLKIDNFKLARLLSDDYLEILPQQTLLFEAATDVVQYLNKHYQLHLITNGFKEVQYKKLTNCGLLQYFKTITTSEEANANKPNKEIFEFAFAQSKANAQNSIMIGDNPFADMQGALNVGMDRILFNTMQHTHQVPVSFEIKKLNELIDIL